MSFHHRGSCESKVDRWRAGGMSGKRHHKEDLGEGPQDSVQNGNALGVLGNGLELKLKPLNETGHGMKQPP